MSLNLSELGRQVMNTKTELRQIKKVITDLAAKFAYYWFEEKRCCFALVIKVYENKADLICFGDHISGHIEVLRGRQMVSPDPEHPKAGRWQSLAYGPAELLDLLAVPEAEPDAEREPTGANAS